MVNSAIPKLLIVSSVGCEHHIRLPECVPADALFALVEFVQSPEAIKVEAARLDTGAPQLAEHSFLVEVTDHLPAVRVDPYQKLDAALTTTRDDFVRANRGLLQLDHGVAEVLEGPVKFTLRAERNRVVAKDGDSAHADFPGFLGLIFAF